MMTRTEWNRWTRSCRERDKASAKALRERERFGLFTWNGDNRYPVEAALDGKLYRSAKMAQKAADKINERIPAANLVVRTIYLPRAEVQS